MCVLTSRVGTLRRARNGGMPQFARGFLDLILGDDPSPYESQNSPNLDHEADLGVAPALHIFMRRPHPRSQQMCGIDEPEGAHFVDRHSHVRTNLRLQQKFRARSSVAIEP